MGPAVDRQQADNARRIWQWRSVMEFFLMLHHGECISLLDPSGLVPGKYDAIGKPLSLRDLAVK